MDTLRKAIAQSFQVLDIERQPLEIEGDTIEHELLAGSMCR